MFFSFFRKNNKTGHKTQVFSNNKPCENSFWFKFFFFKKKIVSLQKKCTMKLISE